MKKIEKKIKELFIESIDNRISGNAIEINENISNYGMNSITFVKFIVSIENEFNIEFDDENLNYNKFPNIKAIIQYVENKVE